MGRLILLGGFQRVQIGPFVFVGVFVSGPPTWHQMAPDGTRCLQNMAGAINVTGMNIKITCENSSVIVPDQSRESTLVAMRTLGYESMQDDGGVQFYRRNDSGNEVQARAVIEPTDLPLS